MMEDNIIILEDDQGNQIEFAVIDVYEFCLLYTSGSSVSKRVYPPIIADTLPCGSVKISATSAYTVFFPKYLSITASQKLPLLEAISSITAVSSKNAPMPTAALITPLIRPRVRTSVLNGLFFCSRITFTLPCSILSLIFYVLSDRFITN